MKTIDFKNGTFMIRLGVAVILLAHSVKTILDGSISGFGKEYLDPMGFAPFGLAIAYAIKISHIVAAICFLFEKYVKLAGIVTIFVLIMGIAMVHWQEGWFVVGGGRNGIEFNFLLILAVLTIMFPNGLTRRKSV
ncbi:DoxX family protein [Flavobacterium sp. MAH-1]|uniref:DoxX family protein n=1 Tax=Flavobacterium agri TaxID=2743471 RepID=A0A7Y8XZD4_9FLAO|nr:DoxX family membrane protein [Flavobacterium agri]NUY79506.1 DoxX family protein [Flavobacterium agri]NYA69531.1 DoxX family protein [Flavobacterium agri]